MDFSVCTQTTKNKNENNIKNIKKYVMVFVGHFDYFKKESNSGGLSYENSLTN